MRKNIRRSLAIFILISAGACAKNNSESQRSPNQEDEVQGEQTPDPVRHVKGELLVRFHEDLTVKERKIIYLLDRSRNISAIELEKLGERGTLYRIAIPATIDLEKAIQILKSTGKFKYVEKNIIYNTMPSKGGGI